MPTVHLFVTCVGEMVDPDVPTATVRVLRAAGCDVEVPAGQTCCGQPAWNAGFAPEAARVAKASLGALHDALVRDEASEGTDDDAVVVVPAGSCATMIRLYWPQLFELVGDETSAERARAVGDRTQELTEFLADRDLPELRGPRQTVALHQSCHLLRELHVADAPGEAVGRVAGCEVAEWPADDRCCGFGGTFSVKLPETSVAMADEKLDTLPDGVRTVVGADASCLLHLRTRAEQRGLPVETMHVAELLADSLPQVVVPRVDRERPADDGTDDG